MFELPEIPWSRSHKERSAKVNSVKSVPRGQISFRLHKFIPLKNLILHKSPVYMTQAGAEMYFSQ